MYSKRGLESPPRRLANDLQGWIQRLGAAMITIRRFPFALAGLLLVVGTLYLVPWWSRVYFLWDDLELLMLLKFHPLAAFFLSHEYQFFPLFQFFYWIELHLFSVNPSLFFLTSVSFHLVNIALAYTLMRQLTKGQFFPMLTAIAVSFNKSFFESIFWPTIQSNLLITTCVLLALRSYFKLGARYRHRDAWILFFLLMVGNFLFGFGIAIGFILAAGAMIFLKNGDTKRVVPILGTVTFVIGAVAILLFSTTELRQEGKIPSLTLRQLGNFLYFTAVGPTEGIITRFFLPGFTPNIYHPLNVVVMIVVPSIVAAVTGYLFVRAIAKKTWRKTLHPLFLFYALVVTPFAIAALVRSASGAHKALADRYVYFPLFFFVLALIYSLSLLEKTCRLKRKHKFFPVLTFASALIIAIGHLVAMSFQANALFL